MASFPRSTALHQPLPSSVAAPQPWHGLNAQNSRARMPTRGLFRALCAQPAHRLSGVAFDDDPALSGMERSFTESSTGIGRVFAFVLDDVRIALIEDANDGYRSTAQQADLEWRGPVRHRFVPVDVNVLWSPRVRWGETFGNDDLGASLIELRCPYTAALILEAGTSWSDEHYPAMVSAFHPEAMVETVRRAEIRVLRTTADEQAADVSPRARSRL